MLLQRWISTDKSGKVPGIDLVYYNPRSLANILSLSQIDSKYRVTYNSSEAKAFIVHNTRGGKKKFNRSKGGLHYYDTSINRSTNYIMMQTVEENKIQFTKKEIEAVENARKIYHIIGRPGYKVFYDILQKGLIHNCTISSQDAKNAYQIYGPDEGALMEKCTRKTPNKVDTSKLYQMSKDFVHKYQHLTLAIDILYFERMPFILTMSRNIYFYKIKKLPDRDSKTLL